MSGFETTHATVLGKHGTDYTRSAQIFNGGIKKQDLNINESGAAVITKVIPGLGVEIDSTGVDHGTGDVK